MDLLVESGKDAGHKEMLPLIGIALGVGALGYAGISKLVKYFKKNKHSPDVIEAAKKELIEGINKYDAENPDTGKEDSKEETEEKE